MSVRTFAWLLPLALALHFALIAGGAKRKKGPSDDTPSDVNPPSPDSFPGEARNSVVFSLTITPLAEQSTGPPIAHQERLFGTHAITQRLAVEFQMRHADGQSPRSLFSCELGDDNRNPHVQAMFVLKTSAVTKEQRASLRGAELAWLKAVVADAYEHRVRFALKYGKAHDASYLAGYCRKDAGLEHYLSRSVGWQYDLARALTMHISLIKYV